jgi:hypothetical protein
MADLHLESWRDFYVMVGTASGAIVGATFVVATLAGNMERREFGMHGFISPTAVHLGTVLIVSALLCIPTLTPFALAIVLGAGALAGAVYALIVMRRIGSHALALEDRVFYAILPLLCYMALGFAAWCAWASDSAHCLNVLAGALIVLLIAGMRNAWDMATFMVLGGPKNNDNATPPA